MASCNDFSDSEEYNIINNVSTPQAFTYLEDNIVELMGGPIDTYTPFIDEQDSISDELSDEQKNSITLNDALTSYEYENTGRELVFSINKQFTDKPQKRKDSKKEKRPIQIHDCTNRLLERLGKCETNFDHGLNYESVEIQKREKRTCENWETQVQKSSKKNAPKIVKRKR